MGRPKTPLINRDDAITTALALIDRDGLETFSIRRLGDELGVNGASLYHHFKDKDEILDGVRRLVLRESGVLATGSKPLTWREYAARSVARYRAALLKHPNIAPLMAPGMMRPLGIAGRESMIETMLDAGVPLALTYPIIDSIETLAFGSALLNPEQARPRDRFKVDNAESYPQLDRALRTAPTSADRLFRLQLDALLDGWTAQIAQIAQIAQAD